MMFEGMDLFCVSTNFGQTINCSGVEKFIEVPAQNPLLYFQRVDSIMTFLQNSDEVCLLIFCQIQKAGYDFACSPDVSLVRGLGEQIACSRPTDK